jgi:hypothetical protein
MRNKYLFFIPHSAFRIPHSEDSQLRFKQNDSSPENFCLLFEVYSLKEEAAKSEMRALRARVSLNPLNEGSFKALAFNHLGETMSVSAADGKGSKQRRLTF